MNADKFNQIIDRWSEYFKGGRQGIIVDLENEATRFWSGKERSVTGAGRFFNDRTVREDSPDGALKKIIGEGAAMGRKVKG